MFLVNIVIDTIFIILAAGEASFTGSAGTKYYLGESHTYGAGAYIIYFAIAAATTLCIHAAPQKSRD